MQRFNYYFTKFRSVNLKRLVNDRIQKASLSVIGKIRGWNGPPIIVYQPGKVGSMTVKKSLENAYGQIGVYAQIHHSHALNHLDRREESLKKTRINPEHSIHQIQEWRRLYEQINNGSVSEWNIVSLVRDPVAIKVSALFQSLNESMPDWEKRYKARTLTLNNLRELLYSRKEFGFRDLDNWYDNQIRALWGIDIFATPFPAKAGYKIYKTENINLMIIRLEDLNRLAEQVFNEFLGLKKFKLVNVNMGHEKPYAALYGEFKKYPLSESYIERAYQSRFAKHFYLDDEIAAFRKYWMKK